MSFPNYVYSNGQVNAFNPHEQLYVTVPHTDRYYKYDIDKWGNPQK